MPGCAAIGCNNRSEKGYSMKCFPRDAKLRQEWKERVGRANWEPSKNSFLCHVHFEPEQWQQGANGRIRLRKDAIPSIFTETSTRKSPKKRRLDNGEGDIHDDLINKNSTLRTIAAKPSDDSDDDNYMLEYLDDCEFEVAYTEEQNIEKHIARINANRLQIKNGLFMRAGQQGLTGVTNDNSEHAFHIISEKDMKGLEKENVIIVSDDNNREIGKLIHDNDNIIIVADKDNEDIGQIIVEENALGQQTQLLGQKQTVKIKATQNKDNYDEIEEKLNQICNGKAVGDCQNIEENDPLSCDTKSVGMGTTNGGNSFNSTTASQISQKNTYPDREIPTNVKIIFGTESGDESRHTRDGNLPNKTQELKAPVTKKTATKVIAERRDSAEESKTLFSDKTDFHKALVREKISVVPNMRAAMDRKRKFREEVMKSVERSIANTFESTLQNLQNNSQLLPSIVGVTRVGRPIEREISEVSYTYENPPQIVDNKFGVGNCDLSSKQSKFTIKVTGVADDVNEIIEGLENTSNHTMVQRNSDTDSSWLLSRENTVEKNDGRPTNSHEQSTGNLRLDDNQMSELDSRDFEEEYIVPDNLPLKNRKKVRSDIKTLFKPNKELIHTEEFATNMRKEESKAEHPTSEDDNEQSMRLKYFSKSWNQSRKSKQKINTQQEVIEKLTNQLIKYKGLESKLVNLNLELQVKNKEIQMLREKLQKKSHTPWQDRADSKKDVEIKQKIIMNLSNKVNQLEEANKQLMHKFRTESLDKKMVYHLKQKDDRIKELNWKLEKASKFLDRAEKNANTYKRKMLSMQTSIKRQKALDEKQSHFKKLMIDNAKHEFSESALNTAMDIKNTCGIKTYMKLLGYDFPLPSLRTLRRRFQKENITEEDWGDEEAPQEHPTHVEVKRSLLDLEISRTNEAGETEVTGTVQDIFEENNDTEDLNSCELGEHIFEHLERERIA